MDALSFILLLLVSGLFVGALGRLIIPGRDPMSVPQTLLVGVAGSLAAGLISYYVFDREGVPGLLLSVVCAALIVFAIRKFRERQVGPAGAPASAYGQPGAFGGGNVQFRFMPGCLIGSLLASLVLTVLLNLLIRAF